MAAAEPKRRGDREPAYFTPRHNQYLERLYKLPSGGVLEAYQTDPDLAKAAHDTVRRRAEAGYNSRAKAAYASQRGLEQEQKKVHFVDEDESQEDDIFDDDEEMQPPPPIFSPNGTHRRLSSASTPPAEMKRPSPQPSPKRRYASQPVQGGLFSPKGSKGSSRTSKSIGPRRPAAKTNFSDLFGLGSRRTILKRHRANRPPSVSTARNPPASAAMRSLQGILDANPTATWADDERTPIAKKIEFPKRPSVSRLLNEENARASPAPVPMQVAQQNEADVEMSDAIDVLLPNAKVSLPRPGEYNPHDETAPQTYDETRQMDTYSEEQARLRVKDFYMPFEHFRKHIERGWISDEASGWQAEPVHRSAFDWSGAKAYNFRTIPQAQMQSNLQAVLKWPHMLEQYDQFGFVPPGMRRFYVRAYKKGEDPVETDKKNQTLERESLKRYRRLLQVDWEKSIGQRTEDGERIFLLSPFAKHEKKWEAWKQLLYDDDELAMVVGRVGDWQYMDADYKNYGIIPADCHIGAPARPGFTEPEWLDWLRTWERWAIRAASDSRMGENNPGRAQLRPEWPEKSKGRWHEFGMAAYEKMGVNDRAKWPPGISQIVAEANAERIAARGLLVSLESTQKYQEWERALCRAGIRTDARYILKHGPPKNWIPCPIVPLHRQARAKESQSPRREAKPDDRRSPSKSSTDASPPRRPATAHSRQSSNLEVEQRMRRTPSISTEKSSPTSSPTAPSAGSSSSSRAPAARTVRRRSPRLKQQEMEQRWRPRGSKEPFGNKVWYK